MVFATAGRTNSYVQFLTVLILFVFVLFLTWGVTKWIAGYQKGRTANANIEMIEAFRLSGNKYVEIVRIGKKYLAIAVGKDSVTMLTEIPEEDLCFTHGEDKPLDFREILNKVQKKDISNNEDRRDE
jgi:flagellar protein FliO/FliZ